MDGTHSQPNGLVPLVDLDFASTDPVVLGLERKLDVLRAELAACRAGEEPGDAGISAWSRLEHQTQQIVALRAEVAALQQTSFVVATERDVLREQVIRVEGTAKTLRQDLRRAQREALCDGAAAERMRDELSRSRQTILTLSQSILDADLQPAPPPPAPAATQDTLLLAMLNSTCWRASRPLRRLGNLVRGRRDAVL